ncbi:GNAT family N-acetyltransferase [Denitrificimonas sp. JX-1]|uniref:GNAT family N-acetyltransferase n=1 Tax=Denitrificimonas halotolerans TaxID=3098930 RepID=A0ABU5GU19_9GAMM|nr:GNAT family N-acetyltransferase [Denitrificimonas sp. JX-1]MDY7220478.1 GNAT family N-acetyltransferase [Denitrificimonas sp. JX-1]
MGYEIQEIQAKYNAKICAIIKRVGQEFGAIGEGFGPSDPEVNAMSEHYTDSTSSKYLVAIVNNDIVGGGGIAPFNGSADVCELRKLFLLPESRGLGIGKKLTEECLAYAKSKGYKQCYLDTLKSMTSAISLYERLGFKHLDAPLEGTIHGGCDVWMLKAL